MQRQTHFITQAYLIICILLTASTGWAAPKLPQEKPEAHPCLSQSHHKGFFISSPNAHFSLRIQGRVQARYALELLNDASNESAFSIPRARIALSGHAFTKALVYKFQADFGKGFVSLKDFYVDHTILPGLLQLRVGQWTRPFSRQQINSSGKLEFVDRAITDKFFGAGRDIGIGIHNDYGHSPTFEYAFGIFNGTGGKPHFSANVTVDRATGEGKATKGRFRNVPDRLHPAMVLRVGYNYGGIKGYSEADFKGGPLRFSLGASGLVDFDADNSDDANMRGELDYSLKLYGFSSTGAIYLASAQSGTGFPDQSFAAIGFHVQTGYLFARYFQVTARYALITPDGIQNNQQEILGGISVYFFKHGLKWQTDAGALLSQKPGPDPKDFRIRTQLQLAF